MSLKSVEMQIAIPRTMDAGKVQDQLQQRGQKLIEHAKEAVQNDVEHNQNRITKNEQSVKSNFLKDREKRVHKLKNRQKKVQREEEQQKEYHPYKGTIIDYSG